MSSKYGSSVSKSEVAAMIEKKKGDKEWMRDMLERGVRDMMYRKRRDAAIKVAVRNMK